MRSCTSVYMCFVYVQAHIILCSSACVGVYVKVRVFLIVDVCMLNPYGLLHSQSYAILQERVALFI